MDKEKPTLKEFKEIITEFPFVKKAIMEGKEKELKELIEEDLKERKNK